jgi:hypothetical protein
MGPLQKEVAEYMFTASRTIASAQTAIELKRWWFSQHEKDMRASLVITGSTPEHRQLYNAFLARGNALATGEHIRSGASSHMKDAAE